jgi:hypothetical protein
MPRVRHWFGSPNGSALPAAVGGLALMLRLWGLGDKPFWLDEVASLHRATATLPDLVADSLHANHYPSYFLLLWFVARIGATQWLLRLPSAVFGAIAAALACMVGRRAAGPRSGAIAGLLMAFSPFEVQYGQEARSYTLVSCLILVALLGLLRLARDPIAAAVPLPRPSAVCGAWAAYALGTAAALCVLNVAVPWLLAANLGAVAIARRSGRSDSGFWRNWGLVQAAILAVWLPLLTVVYVAGHGAVLDGAGWAPAATVETVWSIAAPVYLLRISSFISLDLAPAAVPGLSYAVAALAALGSWQLRREPKALAVIGCAALVPPLSLLLVSHFVPVLVPRYFAWSAAPFFILAGAGLGRLIPMAFAAAAPLLAAGCLINLLPYYQYETKPRWDLLAQRLAAAARPGDVVLLNSYYSYSVFAVFAARAGLTEHGVGLSWQPSEAATLARGHDLWAIYGRAGQQPKETLAEYRRSLADFGRPIAEASVGRYVRVWRFADSEASTAPIAGTTAPAASGPPRTGAEPPR